VIVQVWVRSNDLGISSGQNHNHLNICHNVPGQRTLGYFLLLLCWTVFLVTRDLIRNSEHHFRDAKFECRRRLIVFQYTLVTFTCVNLSELFYGSSLRRSVGRDNGQKCTCKSHAWSVVSSVRTTSIDSIFLYGQSVKLVQGNKALEIKQRQT
jgi:hypothetical protein